MTSIRRPISPRCSTAWRTVIPTTGSTNSCPGTSSPCWPRPPDRAAYPADFANSSLNNRSLSARSSSVVGQHDGLRLADRITDHSLAIQTIQRVPVVALPGSEPVVQRQMKQRQHGLVDLVAVDLHRCISPADRGSSCPPVRRVNHVDRQTLTTSGSWPFEMSRL